jgi:hypothetical protein
MEVLLPNDVKLDGMFKNINDIYKLNAHIFRAEVKIFEFCKGKKLSIRARMQNRSKPQPCQPLDLIFKSQRVT